MILNTLILIVFTLIVVIGYQLLFGGEKEKESNQMAETENDVAENSEQKAKNEEKDEVDKQTETEKNEEKEKEEEQDPLAGATVTEGQPGSDVEQVIENGNWEPIGTEQSGEHVATYDQNSIDWKEMVQAISYATGVAEEDMTIMWLGNNGSPQDAKGTIKKKSDGKQYRVAITWVDGEGWKPTKVEVLK
ncbi:YrrS family protein [Bacillus sp. FJAT-47783]|uniref:YrrS family protein n=1 Tax=Bacillus sp. FJAT-47783 TaxID=2922712 RepID=UPI001FABBB3E|nr:YrrS family protein [Bacillus sp. FJAT-47783]